jgi:hypothetical protein
MLERNRAADEILLREDSYKAGAMGFIGGICFYFCSYAEESLNEVLTDQNICIIFKSRYLMLRFFEGRSNGYE